MKPRVEWQEGLVVGPIHMQLLEDFHEELVHRRVEALAPASWGAISANVRADGGRVTVSFTGVLRDGLYLEKVEASASTDGRADGAPVYLGVKEQSKSIRFSTGAQPDGRYSLESRYEAREWSRPEPPVALDVVGQPRVVVLFEPNDQYTLIKIAELRRVGGSFEPVDSYIPPCLRIGVSPWLVGQLHALIEAMQRKRDALAAEANAPIAAGTPLRLPRVAAQLELHALGSHLLRLAAIGGLLEGTGKAGEVPAELAHPLELYRELLGVIGGLAAFDAGGHAAIGALPSFAIDDLRGCLRPLLERAQALVAGLGRRFHLSLKLAPEGPPKDIGQEFKIALGPDGTWRGGGVYLWVKGTDSKTAAQIALEATNGLIKASGLKRGAIGGRGDTVEPIKGEAPPNLPEPEEGSLYLRINPEQWKQALADGAIVVLAPRGYAVELRAAST